MLEFDDIQHILLTRAPGAHGTLRVSLVSRARRADAPGWRRSRKRCSRPRRCGLRSTRTSAG